MGNNSFFQCSENDRTVYLQLFGFAILFSLISVANPGFFSHTGLEQMDYVHRFGLTAKAGPLSGLIEGLTGWFAGQYPFWLHLFSALLHGVVARLLFLAIGHAGGSRDLAWVSSLVFLACPLVAFATGWVGAYSELFCVLFGLLAFNSAQRFAQGKTGNGALAMVFVASLLAAFFSKNAFVLPLLLPLVAYFFPSENAQGKKLWTSFFVWAVPVLLFLMFQLVGAKSGGAAPGGVGGQLLAVFLYPFMPALTEAHTWTAHSSLSIGLAAALHAALLVLLWRVFSTKAVLAYLSAYLLLALPSLFVSDAGSHSFYPVGIAFGLAIGALLTTNSEASSKAVRIATRLLLAVGLFHTLNVQHYFYKTGTCMNRVAASISSAWVADGKPEKMSIVALPDAPSYILFRFLKDRVSLEPGSKVEFEVVDWNKRNETKTGYQFDCDCQVFEHPDLRLKIGNWGPQELQVNTNPNPQPDGTMGTWIEVSGTENLGELEVLIDGQSAKLTSVQAKMITATFPPDHFTRAGEKVFAVRQVSTGKEFVVGKIRID